MIQQPGNNEESERLVKQQQAERIAGAHAESPLDVAEDDDFIQAFVDSLNANALESEAYWASRQSSDPGD